jgi:hypothetical protein
MPPVFKEGIFLFKAEGYGDNHFGFELHLPKE